MPRKLLLLLAILFASVQAQAQVFAVHFTDEKSASKYKKHLVHVNGEDVVVGEAWKGITYDAKKRQISWPPSGKVELFVADPKDPTSVPYRLEGEGRVVTDKKQVLGVQTQHIGRMSILIEHQSLQGLAAEYAVRMRQVGDLESARDAEPQGSSGWFAFHRRMVAALERLQSWLASTAFPAAAEKLAKEIERQRKVVQADAAAARLRAARESIREVETPERLVEASAAITGGEARFRVAESQHIRIVYLEEIGITRVRALLDFGEMAIAGFRTDCVDPYADEEFEDTIPDGLLSEFWFGPARLDHHEAFLVQYYGESWGPRKEQVLDIPGTRVRRIRPPEHLDYWKYEDTRDLQALVAHALGHHLASAHYDGNRRDMPQDWLTEGVALYVSLEYFGRNTVTCRSFAPEGQGRYVHEKGKEGEKTLQIGLRGYFNALALELGPPIEKLALKELYEMEDADLAKSWSFYDYLVRREGRRGQELLRSACDHGRSRSSFVQSWREDAEALWQVRGRDVFQLIDDSWREFATVDQDTGDSARSRMIGPR